MLWSFAVVTAGVEEHPSWPHVWSWKVRVAVLTKNVVSPVTKIFHLRLGALVLRYIHRIHLKWTWMRDPLWDLNKLASRTYTIQAPNRWLEWRKEEKKKIERKISWKLWCTSIHWRRGEGEESLSAYWIPGFICGLWIWVWNKVAEF